MANVKLRNIKKVYGKDIVAVQDFNLEITDKEFVVLLGPSGCGKSTTLRMIAGLEEITEGELHIDEKYANDVAPKDRDIAMVFQNYALYPHMTVYENMAFALKLRKVPKAKIKEMVNRAAQILDIAELLQRRPKALSGGQRQRVAIGRAIVRDPKVFLMDEPLSNLDAKLRNQMRTEIIKLRERINTTFVYVTHDQTEAMTLGDRIVVMKDGFIQQIGTPQEVFNRPNNLFVAGFIGSPQMNFFDAALRKRSGRYYVAIGETDIELADDMVQMLSKAEHLPENIMLGIRPENIHISSQPHIGMLKAVVDVSEMMGSEVYLHVNINGITAVVCVKTADAPRISRSAHEFTYLKFEDTYIHLFNKENGENLLFSGKKQMPKDS